MLSQGLSLSDGLGLMLTQGLSLSDGLGLRLTAGFVSLCWFDVDVNRGVCLPMLVWC